jgi:hypothetical protein
VHVVRRQFDKTQQNPPSKSSLVHFVKCSLKYEKNEIFQIQNKHKASTTPILFSKSSA